MDGMLPTERLKRVLLVAMGGGTKGSRAPLLISLLCLPSIAHMPFLLQLIQVRIGRDSFWLRAIL
uniref:Uncharacterized protein n=1 Tax=Utricularia reniformis TaxID=192314 RepID=A0A1Y0B1T7_9LAMI|nr:hypothetical protein AEK19_MT1135 [Utricularia reniformis]ART31351.1 hypothetical protein AEK19_MT1135 [Utricularia reniformis]